MEKETVDGKLLVCPLIPDLCLRFAGKDVRGVARVGAKVCVDGVECLGSRLRRAVTHPRED